MRIALVQQRVPAERTANVARALAAFERAASEGAALVCFPELGFERFHPQRPASGDVAALAEPIPGPTTEAFAARAKSLGVVAVLNLFERDGTRTDDCSPVIDADGRLVGRARMLHITDYACFHEQGYYTPGDTGVPVFETAAGRIGVAICYDRHYPEVMRALALGGAELVLVPQAGAVGEWPEGLFEAEMRVAAFQNGYFVALCNRVGAEECLTFAGESFVAAPDGTVTARAARLEEDLLLVDVDLGAVATSHARRLFLRDRRPELYADWFGAAAGTKAHARSPAP
jgi:N-carbamoylputrescine amidase